MERKNIKKKKLKQKSKKQLSRRELRKQKLEEKKQNKRLFFSNKTHGKELVAAAKKEQLNSAEKTAKVKRKKSKKKVSAPNVDTPLDQLMHVDSADDNSIDSDFSDPEVDALMPTKKPSKIVTTQLSGIKKGKMAPRPDTEVMRLRELKRQKELASAARKQRVKQLKVENEEEDKIIHSLEKKLKLNRAKDKNKLVRKMFTVDGLDWALDFCLDDDESKTPKKSQSKIDQMQDGEMDDFSEDLDEDDDDNDENDSQMEDDDDEDSANEEENTKPKVTEDIYGRKRDEHGNVIDSNDNTGKYVPPHKRVELNNTEDKDDKERQLLERLHKSTKGLLNRLSEANLHKIATGIEQLYMKHARYYMNDTLAKLLIEALITPNICNERMLQEHTVLLAYLHAQIGSEIGANFLQIFIQQFDNYVQNLSELSIEDKKLNNLVLLLSYMYMFRIYDHSLLLEIIEKLIGKLCEKSVECLLLIFQSVGIKLRKDDPMAFKQMLLSVQQSVLAAPLDTQENLRLKFMVDVLHALKNNNLHKLPQVDPELPENLRKRLKGMLRQDKYVITLNIGMTDILRADQAGKWWIVGSAWTGNIAPQTDNKAQQKEPQRFSDKLLALARAQHMNTDERRHIFCIIMSAEDYMDAFQKIIQLKVKDQRSIAYVILHCCLQEKRANPYYAHLAIRFCEFNRSFRLFIQHVSWDRIRELDSLSKLQIRNFGKFLLLLIARGALELHVLSPIDFVSLNKPSFLLMKEIMLGLLLWPQNDTEVTLEQILQKFERLTKDTKHTRFKNSIRLFIDHFLLKNINKSGDDAPLFNIKLDEENANLLQKRCDIVDNVLSYIAGF